MCLKVLGLADESKIYSQGAGNSENSQNNNPDGGDDGNSRGSGGSTPDSNSQSENRNNSGGANQSEGNSQNGSDNTGNPCDSTTFSQRQAFRDSSIPNLHRKERTLNADWMNPIAPSSRDMAVYSNRRTVSDEEGGRVYGKSYHHEMSGGRYLAIPPRYLGERYPHHDRELGYRQLHRDSSHTHRYPLPDGLIRLQERFLEGEEYDSHWDHVTGDHGYRTDDYYRDLLATDRDLHSNHHQQAEPLNLSVAQHNR